MLRRLVVSLPQFHTDARRGAHTHSCTKSRAQIHEGEGDAQTSNSLRTYDLADHGTVDDIIEARRRHGHNSRQGILPKQLSYRLLSQFEGGLLIICHVMFSYCDAKVQKIIGPYKDFQKIFVTLATPNLLGTQKSPNIFGFSFVFS